MLVDLLFGLITHLEMVMAKVLEEEFECTDGWLERLPENRRRKIQAEIAAANQKDGIVDALLFTQFADKVTAISRSPIFKLENGKFYGELKRIQSLRNLLAHANDYAATPEMASRVCSTVRLIDKWTEEFSDWPRRKTLAQSRRG